MVGSVTLSLDETLKALRSSRFDLRSPQKLKSIIDEAAPPEGEPHPFVDDFGTNGKAYRIRWTDLLDYLAERERRIEDEDRRKREAVAQASLPLAGGEARGEHLIPADQRLEFARAESAMNKVRRERGELVEADLVEATDALRMKFIATFLQGLPDAIAKRVPDLAPTAVAELVVAVDEFQERLARYLVDTNFLSPEAGVRIAAFLRDADLLEPGTYEAVARRWKELLSAADLGTDREDVPVAAVAAIPPVG